MLLMLIEVVPLLVSVTALAAPLLPTATETQLKDVGLTDALPPVVPPVPSPESATVWGLGLALSLKLRVAVRVPLTVGAKMMFAVQLAETARLDPHVLELIRKSCGFVPLNVMLLIVRVAVPLFVNVTTFWAPLFPTATEAQLRLVGETEAARHIAEDITLRPAIAMIRCSNLLLARCSVANFTVWYSRLWTEAQLGLGKRMRVIGNSSF
jgi:hypothetical protein